MDYETKSSYTVKVLVHDGKDADGNTDTSIDDTITVTVLVYKPASTTGDQTTHVVQEQTQTTFQTGDAGLAVVFPEGATADNPFQVRVDPDPAQCGISPSQGTLTSCIQVDLFTLAGTPWVGVTPFTSANVTIVAISTGVNRVYRRDSLNDPWTTIPRCSNADTRECFSASENLVTIRNIQEFSQFAVARMQTSSQVVAPTATALPTETVIPTPTPGGGVTATITRRRRAGSIVPATATPAPMMVATPAPTEMASQPTETPAPTSVASTAVPPTPELRAGVQPTAAPPPLAPTRSATPTAAPPVAPAPTDSPAAVAAIPNTPVPAATTALPTTAAAGGGFPLWLIAVIVVAVIVAGGLGFGAWRLLRSQ